jgi:UDP-N-acetylglucosamine--N-acetylmuramyl-(pentapeptide) pyrophosphoryl-undecaprenol N-acetylglucosamine transferase
VTRCIVLAVGDTAGHVTPALAIADAYKDLVRDIDVRFLSAGEGTGHWLIARAGYHVDYVPGSQIARTTLLRQGLALGRTALGVAHARRVLRRHGVRLVIGTGGYGSAGALLGARTLGLMTALVEPNVVPGLTNRLLGRIAHRAYLGFAEAATSFPPERTLVTGIPVRQPPAAATLRQVPALPRVNVLVMSGSRGQDFLGQRVPELLAALARHDLQIHVHHQGGTSTAAISHAYERLHIPARVEPFIDNVAEALAWADIAIARAGAGTIAELSAAGVPTLLIPLADAAHDHQGENAKALVARGAALSTREGTWATEELANQLSMLLHNADSMRSMSRAMQGVTDRDGAAHIVRDCEALMQGRW